MGVPREYTGQIKQLDLLVQRILCMKLRPCSSSRWEEGKGVSKPVLCCMGGINDCDATTATPLGGAEAADSWKSCEEQTAAAVAEASGKARTRVGTVSLLSLETSNQTNFQSAHL